MLKIYDIKQNSCFNFSNYMQKVILIKEIEFGFCTLQRQSKMSFTHIQRVMCISKKMVRSSYAIYIRRKDCIFINSGGIIMCEG